MHKYRTHNCSELRPNHENTTVKLSGWVHRKRDHGNLLFIDLRDHYGITQCVIENTNKNFKILEKISKILEKFQNFQKNVKIRILIKKSKKSQKSQKR